MLLLLHIIVTYIKENIITRLQKLYSPPRNSRVGNKLPVLFVKKPLCTGDLSPTHKIFIERPEHPFCRSYFHENLKNIFSKVNCLAFTFWNTKIIIKTIRHNQSLQVNFEFVPKSEMSS